MVFKYFTLKTEKGLYIFFICVLFILFIIFLQVPVVQSMISQQLFHLYIKF